MLDRDDGDSGDGDDRISSGDPATLKKSIT
jgi:hypothetical protein